MKAWIIKTALNAYYRKELHVLTMTAEDGLIKADVMLEGEKEPVHIELDYVMEDGRLAIRQVVCDRQWMTDVCSAYVEGESFDVPAALALVL